MTQRLEELIWAEVDGELTAAEARELVDLRAGTTAPPGLESSTETEIKELAAGLAAVEDVEVPDGLDSKILTVVAERRRAESRDRPASLETRRGPKRPFFRAKWGYLAAGFLVGGVLVYQLASRTDPGPESGLVGTVPARPPANGGAALPEYLRMAVRDRFLEVSLDLGPGLTTLALEATGLELERVGFADGARGAHQAGADRISVEAAGPGRIDLVLIAPDWDSPIRLSVAGDGVESLEAEFIIDQLSGH